MAVMARTRTGVAAADPGGVRAPAPVSRASVWGRGAGEAEDSTDDGWCDLSTPLSRADAFDAEAAAYERQAIHETAAYGACYYAELLREMATDRRAWAARLRAEVARLLGGISQQPGR